MGECIDLDCGIAFSRISTWLDCELELTRGDDGWIYRIGQSTCLVRAEPLESRPLGTLRLALERTHVMATGDQEALAAFNKAFTLRFISAGG